MEFFSGDHHHFIWLRPETEIEVYIPIAIHPDHGSVEDISKVTSTEP